MSHASQSGTAARRRFHHAGTEIWVGRGAVDNAAQALSDVLGANPLIVIGAGAADNADLRTTTDSAFRAIGGQLHLKHGSAKDLEVVARGVAAAMTGGCTGVLATGGGDTLDLGKQIAFYAADPERLTRARSDPQSAKPDPAAPTLPLAVLPTSLAGSGLSAWASAVVRDARPAATVRARADLRLAIYDAAVFESTPVAHLRASFFNGFHKGIETLYSRGSSPASDATSIMGCRRLIAGADGLTVGNELRAPRTEELLEGIILVQLHRRLSLIHAICHGVSRSLGVAQGLAHAAVSPTVLAWMLPRLGTVANRIVEAFDVIGEDAVLHRILELRSSLGLPGGLAALGVTSITDELVGAVQRDAMFGALPEHLRPDGSTLRSLLERALHPTPVPTAPA